MTVQLFRNFGVMYNRFLVFLFCCFLAFSLSCFFAFPTHAAMEDIAKCANTLAVDLNAELKTCSARYGVDIDSGRVVYSGKEAEGYNICVKKYYEDLNAGLKECYQNNSFDSFWDMPVLKQSLIDQIGDYISLSPKQSAVLDSCVRGVADKYDLKRYLDMAPDIALNIQNEISNCFENAGMKSTTKVYQNAAIAIDCGKETLGIKNLREAGDVFLKRTPEQSAYLEKCLIRRLSPIAIGAAAVNIPLAAGWQNSILLMQFIFTQPILLLAKKGGKRGQVFNMLNKKPVDLSLVRLFENKTGKIARSMVTNHNGEYFFLANMGEYRLEVKKPDYKFPSDLAKGERFAESYYFGEPISISGSDDTLAKNVPLDPEILSAKKSLFYWKRIKKNFAVALAFSAPLFAALSLFLVFRWWTALLLFFHIFLLFFFIRLVLREKAEKFGVVRDGNNRPLSGVMVYLFKNEFSKLLGYCVSDIFGRYYFPSMLGEYTLVFKKKGYEDVKSAITLKSAGTPNMAVKMEKI